MRPLPFQTEKADSIREEILAALKRPKPSVILLEAPTGAGKTLIVTEAIQPIRHEAAYVWLSYYPRINDQSATRLQKYGIPAADIVEINAGTGVRHLERGKVHFLNFQKLGKGSLLDTGSDTVVSFRELLRHARCHNLPVVGIIDEAHFGSRGDRDSNEAASILERVIASDELPFTCFLGVTATPARFKALLDRIQDSAPDALGYRSESGGEIKIKTVKDAKLLKHDLDITYGDSATGNISDIAVTICKRAMGAFKGIKARWKAQDPYVVPLAVVQIPDRFDEHNPLFIKDFITVYETETGEALRDAEIRHCFEDCTTPWGVEYIAPQDIEDSPLVKVVFFKAALTTGWDCPRAELLVSMRPMHARTAIVQLVGRMLRNPQGFQVENPAEPDLDVAFLYLPFYDKQVIEGIESEYRDGLSGIRVNKARRVLQWNTALEGQRPAIEAVLATLRTARKIWQGNNAPARVKELREEILSSSARDLDKQKLVEPLNRWLETLELTVLEACSDALARVAEGGSGESIQLTTVRHGTGDTDRATVDVDQRDDLRCSNDVVEKVRRAKDGITEDILRKIDESLRHDTKRNPRGVRYPLLFLSRRGRLNTILKEAIEAVIDELRSVLEAIRAEVGKQDSEPRRRIRRMARALMDIDLTITYEEWECPAEQTATKVEGEVWPKVTKAIHVDEDGCSPLGSRPEAEIRMQLESNEDVVAYLRNPQRGRGLAIRYTWREGEERGEDVTYPDFIVIWGKRADPKTWAVQIIECKGGANREHEEAKYVGLGEYPRTMEEEEVKTRLDVVWAEVPDRVHIVRPNRTQFKDKMVVGRPTTDKMAQGLEGLVARESRLVF